MKLPRYTATQPAQGSGAVRAGNISALTKNSDQALYSGLGAFGRGLAAAGELAFKATMKRQSLDDKIESGRATQMIKELHRTKVDEAALYDASSDMPMPDDPDYLKTVTTFNVNKRDELTVAAQKEFLEKTNTIYGSIKSPRVKAEIGEWIQNNVSNFGEVIRKKYGEKLNDYQYAELEKLAFDSAKNGDLDTANQYVDLMDEYELVTREKANDLKQAVLLQMAESDARNAIQLARLEGKGISEALSEGYQTIETYRDKVTKTSDIHSLTNKIERDFTIMLTGEFLRNEENKANTKDEAIKLIRDPNATASAMDNLLDNSSVEDDKAAEIKEAQMVRARKGPPTTDATAFNNIIDDFVDSLEDPDIDITNVLNEKYIDRKLSDNDYDALTQWMGREYPVSIVPSIKDAIEHGKNTIPVKFKAVSTFPSPMVFQKPRPTDNDRVALYNKAIMDFLSKSEKPTTKEIIQESRVLANLYKNMPDDKVKQGRRVDSMVEPASKGEFDKAMDSINSIEGRRKYWQKWYKKAKQQGWLKKK